MTQQSAIGRCPECGLVSGDAVDYRFPNPAKCNQCGSELEKTTIATEEEISKHVA